MVCDNLATVTIVRSDRALIARSAGLGKAILGERWPALTVDIAGIYDSGWLLEIEAVAAAWPVTGPARAGGCAPDAGSARPDAGPDARRRPDARSPGFPQGFNGLNQGLRAPQATGARRVAVSALSAIKG